MAVAVGVTVVRSEVVDATVVLALVVWDELPVVVVGTVVETPVLGEEVGDLVLKVVELGVRVGGDVLIILGLVAVWNV